MSDPHVSTFPFLRNGCAEVAAIAGFMGDLSPLPEPGLREIKGSPRDHFLLLLPSCAGLFHQNKLALQLPCTGSLWSAVVDRPIHQRACPSSWSGVVAVSFRWWPRIPRLWDKRYPTGIARRSPSFVPNRTVAFAGVFWSPFSPVSLHARPYFPPLQNSVGLA
jgi:hypothetical protein